jgi:hypothetical protein
MKKYAPKGAYTAGFWSGVILLTSIQGFIQDCYGKDAWIQMINERWVNMSPWWWVIPSLIPIVLYVSISSTKQVTQ